MAERIGVVLSDVDGTQIKPNAGGLPSPAVQAAARGLRHNNIPLLEVTSRSHGLLRKIVEPLDLRDNLCTLDGGATVAHADSGNVVWSQWLDAETKRNVVMTIGGLCMRINFDMVSRSQEPHEVLAALDVESANMEGAPAIFAVFDARKGDEIVEALTSISGIKHTPIMGYDKNPDWRCIQVVDTDVDKQYGVKQMLHYADLAGENALAIGDGTNDISLFAAVGANGVKVAMGNADEQLKDLADWVAPHVEDDGFAVAMEWYGLI